MSWQFMRFERHPSWGVGAICCGLLAGIVLAQSITLTGVHWMFLAALSILLGLLLLRVRTVTLIALFLTASCIGLIRGSDVDEQLNKTRELAGATVIILGVIAEDPSMSVKGEQRVILNQLRSGSTMYAGTLWASGIKGEYRRGDVVEIHGMAQEGFATYQLAMYRPTVRNVKRYNDPIIAFRDSFASAVRTGVVEPAASLGIGFVIGQKSALPPELEDQLRIVGLTHLVVASGYNLTILIRFAKRLFEKHSRFLVNASSISMVTLFMMISGASPSMVRAGIVSGLSLLVWNYGRTIHPVSLILFVAALTSVMNPNYLWADVGWWLSFLAFFGVLVISPLAMQVIARVRHYEDGKKPSNVTQLVGEAIAAQVMTLPVTLYVFGTMPILALVANIVTAPLVPIAMVSTAIAGLGSMIVPTLTHIVSMPATILLSYFVAVVRYLSSFTWASQEATISFAAMMIFYICLGIVICIVWRKISYNFRQQSIID